MWQTSGNLTFSLPSKALPILTMYLVVSTLYFIAQNDDRKLGMPTTQASHKNYIWNVMYDIQINYNKHQKVTRFFQSRVWGKTKKRLHRVEYMPQQHNPGAQDLNLESHHRTVISAIHWIGLMLCNTVPHAGGNLTLLLLPMPASQQNQKWNVANDLHDYELL